MVYDILGHRKHVLESPFTCLDWEFFPAIYGKNLSEIYTASGVQLEDLAGSAIIVNSGLTQLLYNIFITLKKVDIPVKAFRIKEEAFEWLLKLKKLHE